MLGALLGVMNVECWIVLTVGGYVEDTIASCGLHL